MSVATTGESGPFAWAAASDIGRMRHENQDAWVVREVCGGVLFAVADGMGGHPNGAWAARFACAALVDALESSPPGQIPDLSAVVVDLNLRLVREALRLGTPGAGTTLTAVLADAQELHWVHIGDTRLYVLDAGSLVQVTRDHNLASEPGGHPRLANVLTRCLGSSGDVEPDAGRMPLPPAWLLATDGLYQQVEPERLQGALEGGDPPAAAVHLVELANIGGGPDNITVVLARLLATG
ncbi:MAG: hypothetical protein KatS3mg062_0168 [Tepidiforma sp.]|nr:MAG: hypothetical protein KatS3mg062_0168 [Tepidiforma sp.]